MYKLLIVDDEVWSRRLIREVLDWKKLNFTDIYEAEDGEDALKLLDKHHPDLMIMDMRMPGVDGMELLSRMDKSLKTKIIVMSGFDDFDYLRQALKVNAIDYLLKPINKEEIERAVLEALSLFKQNHIELNLLSLATDLKSNQAFIKYLNLKHQLYSTIINQDERMAVNYLHEIKDNLNQKEQAIAFKSYVFTDLSFMIDELIKAHISKKQEDLLPSFDEKEQPMTYLLHKMIAFMDIMKKRDTKSKLYIEEVKKYVDSHYTQNITLESLASLFYISKEHLSRAFKKETKENLTAYVNKKRIHYAKQLMASRHFSPKTASAMSGFVYIHYFYKVFKRETGMTPLQYVSSKNINIV